MDERRLGRALAARKGKPGLFIIDAGDNSTSDISSLKPTMNILDEAGISYRSINLNSEININDLIAQMQDLQKQGCDSVHLIGMQEWLKEREQFNDRTATRADILNIQRENLFKIPVMLLVWLSPKGIEEFSGMLDLWSWRQGVYNLQNKEAAPLPRLPRP